MQRLYKIYCLFFFFSFYSAETFSRQVPVNSQQFFLDDSIIDVTITTDIKNLRTEKKVPKWQPANIIMDFSNGDEIKEQIRMEPRGVYRKANCDLAALMIDFKSPSSPVLSPLKKLKLVGSCHTGSTNEIFLLKEYLVYKIYNLLSIMSYRVRLLHVTYNDSKQKIKSFSQYAFLIEDMKDMAERNNCVEKKPKVVANGTMNKYQITFVSIFQYMIGNTDWAPGNFHNIKVMVPKNDTLAKYYTIPYDFDYCGLVNAPYATPAENADIKNVTERFYMGSPRTLDELQGILNVFKEKKESINLLITNFPLLLEKIKKDMIHYIDQFYQIIENKNLVRSIFVNGAS